MKRFAGELPGSSRWRLAVPAAVAVALLAVGVAFAAYFASSGSGASDSSVAAPALSPTPVASPSASPPPSPVATPSVSPTAAPVATPSVSPAPTPVYGPPTPYAPMALDAPGRPSCPEDWAAYDISGASYAFCAPQGWDVIVGSSTARMVEVWNPAFSARMAESWLKGGGILPGEVTVVIDNEPKVSTVEEWAESCHQFELTVSGEQAFGCVQYGAPMLGTPEDVMRVHVWFDHGETILIVGGAFKVSEAADANKETLLELARSIQLR